MHSFDAHATLHRRVRFETFEERLALSAHGLGTLAATEEPLLALHVDSTTLMEPAGDFDLESRLGGVSQRDGETTPWLSDVHEMTGVHYAHNTFGLHGVGQTVAIIDSGIAYDHLALGGGFGSGARVVGGWDFAEGDADPYDDGPAGFHGTHVAGIVGSDSGTFTGVAPGADLVALRVFDDNGAGYFSWVEQALSWVHDHRLDFSSPITTVNLSLGTDWNSDSIPSWAMLEDEFAQLKADGVFITVSAGNSFQDYGTTGLSYPAASSLVVPVASVDNDGGFSSFSQRNDRVLAAPGRSITSTVPDHTFGADGNPNDFGTASGTSMAAPYVAGASALVREAMQFAGLQDVTQDSIYTHLRDTADLFFDAATNDTYHRLNLRAALDALLPADDYGSSEGEAHDLGNLNDTLRVNGLINSLGDRDFFRFTAGATGTVSLSTSSPISQLDVVNEAVTRSSDEVSFAVVAGESYLFSFSAGETVEHFEVDLTLTPTAIELGVTDYIQRTEQLHGGDLIYELTASRDGLLTVLLGSDHSDTWQIHVSDSASTPLSSVSSLQNRSDVAVQAGHTYRVTISGPGAELQVVMANLVHMSASQVRAYGTTEDDVFSFDARTDTLTLQGLEYVLDGQSEIQLFAGAGHDEIRLHGTDEGERAVLRVGSFEITHAVWRIDGSDFEHVQVHGHGGRDVAVLHDSAGDDQFYATPSWARLEHRTDGSYSHYVDGFENVQAVASAGKDLAYLYDSTADDRFWADDRFAELRAKNFAYHNQAFQFDNVYAYAHAGGSDLAYLYDSANDDHFYGRPDDATMRARDYAYYNQVFDFEYVYAYARQGTDLAHLHDSAGQDRFIARPDNAILRAHDYTFYNQVFAFDYVYASAHNGGLDLAYLYDSANDDMFYGRPFDAIMRALDYAYYNQALHFDNVYAFAAAGGHDRAVLWDSAADDRFYGRPGEATLRAVDYSYYTQATGFSHVEAHATGGGRDLAHFFDSLADDDRFQISRQRARMWNSDGSYSNQADGFDHVLAYTKPSSDAFYELLLSRVHEASDSPGETELSAVDHFFETDGQWTEFE